VVAESYHEGWTAEAEGRRLPVVRVNGDFLGCVVDTGSHRVSLRFRPRSLVLGRQVTLLGLALTAATAGGLLVPRRPRPSPAEAGRRVHAGESAPAAPMAAGAWGRAAGLNAGSRTVRIEARPE